MATSEVNEKSDKYVEMSETWNLPIALMGGTTAMRLSTITYLPQEPAEEDDSYTDRLNKSVLFNAFKRTLTNLTGKVFAKPLVVEGAPSIQEEWMENIDLAGNGLPVWAREVFLKGLELGVTHCLVDVPRAKEGLNKAEEIALNIRPYFIHVKPEDVIGWRSEIINGVPTLTLVRIKETTTIADETFGEIVVNRIRVLLPGAFIVYEENPDSNEWSVVEEGETSIDYIPLVTFYTNKVGFMMGTPALEDLAWLNVQHWQSSSDQRHILHIARVPLLVGMGLDTEDEKDVVIGPNRLIKIGADSKIAYVEHSGDAIKSGVDDLSAIEERMRIMGLELLMPRTGDQTATAKALDYSEANSSLQVMAINFGDFLENCFNVAADYVKISKETMGSIKVNTEFGLSVLQSVELPELLKMRMAGEISRESYWHELKRRSVLSEEFDPEIEKVRLEHEVLENALGPNDEEDESLDPNDEEEPVIGVEEE